MTWTTYQEIAKSIIIRHVFLSTTNGGEKCTCKYSLKRTITKKKLLKKPTITIIEVYGIEPRYIEKRAPYSLCRWNGGILIIFRGKAIFKLHLEKYLRTCQVEHCEE